MTAGYFLKSPPEKVGHGQCAQLVHCLNQPGFGARGSARDYPVGRVFELMPSNQGRVARTGFAAPQFA